MSRRPEVPAALRERFAARIRVLWVARGGSPEAAEPVVTETLGRVVEAMLQQRIDNLDSVPRFVYTTAREVCEESAAILHERQNGNGDPLAVLADPRMTARVSAALGRVPESDRLLLDGYYRRCLSAQVIALNLGLGPGAVRRRKDQALQRLRDLRDPGSREPDLEPELVDS